MLVGSVKKLMYQNVKFVWKIKTQQRPNKHDSEKKKCVPMKKAKQPFYNTCLCPHGT